MDAPDRHALILRFRERRWLTAAAAVVGLGLLLTAAEAGSWAETKRLWILAGLHGLPFFLVHAVWTRRRMACDPALLPVVYVLTGIGLMLMISLSAESLAPGFAAGSAAGTLAAGAFSFIDTRRAFWQRRHVLWLGAALGLAVVLFMAGSGPAGSGARVNLTIPYAGRVQPVEVVKLCLLLFMAGYFARNWRFLRELRQRPPGPRPARFILSKVNVPRARDVLPVTAGVAVAIASCFVLRDMGPALVVGCTFLLLYGAARGRWQAATAGFVVMAGGFWTIYRTGAVPVVAERMAMLHSPWDNFVDGGEHLAHAYWALASGGLAGVGPGRGSAGAIPAAHTDMVFPAVGEELGFVGLVALLFLYGVLLTRALHVARRASGAFGLFLASGTALIWLFQLFLIAGGTTGLAPLSGVVTPFVSYGKSSMIVNGVLVGFLASISNTAFPEPARVRRRAVKQFATPLTVAGAAAVLLLGALAVRAFLVQVVHADAWVVRPALVLRQSGERDFVYNPRVYEARRRLGLGTIYDRNGIALAVDDSVRTYPFGPLTFYLLGDVERRVKWGAPNSLYAEHRYHSYLRGYDNHPRVVRVDGRAAVRYDYRELRPLIGPPKPAAARMLSRRRDLRLTVDVRLQERVTRVLQDLRPDGRTTSAIVLDAMTGEVLASVTVPLPALDAGGHADPGAFDRGFGAGAKPPGSIFKLVTAMAALDALGSGAAGWTREVRASDRYARRGEPTGTVDLRRALVSSSNVYFAALAREVVGPERLVAAAEVFGFHMGAGQPSTREQVDQLREPDNLRQAGFGQGPVVASPLEAVQVAASIANGGLHIPPRWILTSPDDGLPLPRAHARRVMASEHARFLAEALRGVVTDPWGTASLLRDAEIPIAGKTGTAEEAAAGGRRNHAWFAGFAPYRDPHDGARDDAHGRGALRNSPRTERTAGVRPVVAAAGSPSVEPRRTIAVAVLVEEGGHGGTVAAPIARAVIEAAADLGIIAGPTQAAPSTRTTRGPQPLLSRADR